MTTPLLEPSDAHHPCDTCGGEGLVEETLSAPWLTRELVCDDCGGSGCAPDCPEFAFGGAW